MVKKMCVHVKKLCNRCEQFSKKNRRHLLLDREGEKGQNRERRRESKGRRGESTSETEKRLDGRTLAVQRCSLGSTFKELSSEGWLSREKG